MRGLVLLLAMAGVALWARLSRYALKDIWRNWRGK